MKFLVLWDHSAHPKGIKNPFDIVKEDLQRGIMKEWGAFPGSGKGFLILEVENVSQAFKELNKYRGSGIDFLSSETYLTVEEIERVFSA